MTFFLSNSELNTSIKVSSAPVSAHTRPLIAQCLLHFTSCAMVALCAPSFVPPRHITFQPRYSPPTTVLLVGLHPHAGKCLQTTTSTVRTASKASEVANPRDTTVAAPTATLLRLGAAYVALMSTLHQAPLINAKD